MQNKIITYHRQQEPEYFQWENTVIDNIGSILHIPRPAAERVANQNQITLSVAWGESITAEDTATHISKSIL